MLDWDKLRIFHAVAVAQSLTKAGEALNVSQSAISRQISTLESNLQVALFHRHARGLVLTEQGEILLNAVNSILSQLTAAENALIETRERPRGPLKITAPVGFGTNWLARVVREFYEQFPEISVTLLVDDRELDLTMREADVAIRLFPARHPDLVQKKLASFSNSLYASKDYLAEHGFPKKAEELLKHKLIAYPEDVRLPFAEVNWPLQIAGLKGEAKPALRINSLVGILQAVESGFGIAGLPDYIMHGHKSVVKLLPEIKGPVTDMYFIYPVELRNSKRINVFRDFLVKKLAQSGLTVSKSAEVG
jgi:DNA-binding transcriptional LysR family regulator